MGRRSKTPQVLVEPAAYRAALIHVLTTPQREVAGLLVGSWDDGRRIVASYTPHTQLDSSTDKEMVVNEAYLFRKLRLIERVMAGSACTVGFLHSHVYPDLASGFIAPQISTADVRSLSQGQIEIIMAVCQWAGTKRLKTRDQTHVIRIAGWCVRTEAWYKTKRSIRPCPLVVLGG